MHDENMATALLEYFHDGEVNWHVESLAIHFKVAHNLIY